MLVLAGCAGAGGSRSVPAPSHAASGASGFSVPAAITRAIPPPPPAMTPAKPSTAGRSTRAAAAHPAFFAGEAALSNGVYYLALPNGNPFGYYSYLTDQNYIYHFDLGYEYLIDANDGKGGIYLYDFASSHWWYTGREYPFPYVYDFTLSAVLYYYPDANNQGHYTTNPRYFYDFGTGSIITLPAPATPGTAQNVYVADFDPNANGGPSQFVVFPGSARGAVTPSRTIPTGFNSEKTDLVITPAGTFFECGQMYAANTAQLPGGCGAEARDKSNGHLYLAAFSQVAEYSADGSQTLRTIPLNDPFIRTQAIAVDSGGNLFVGDSGTHEIDVYPPGATTPSRHLGNVPNSPIYYPYALAFDSHDNLYDLDNGSLLVFTPNSNGATSSGGGGGGTSLTIDEKDDLYIGNQGQPGGAGPTITVIPPNAASFTLDLTGVVKYPASISIGP